MDLAPLAKQKGTRFVDAARLYADDRKTGVLPNIAVTVFRDNSCRRLAKIFGNHEYVARGEHDVITVFAALAASPAFEPKRFVKSNRVFFYILC